MQHIDELWMLQKPPAGFAEIVAATMILAGQEGKANIPGGDEEARIAWWRQTGRKFFRKHQGHWLMMDPLRAVLEDLLSRDNLRNDGFLRSQMTKQLSKLRSTSM